MEALGDADAGKLAPSAPRRSRGLCCAMLHSMPVVRYARGLVIGSGGGHCRQECFSVIGGIVDVDFARFVWYGAGMAPSCPWFASHHVVLLYSMLASGRFVVRLARVRIVQHPGGLS